MHRNWTDLIKPKSVEIEKESRTDKYCRFICEPLERGFGQTIGNGLRRILLSSLQGAAITAVKSKALSMNSWLCPKFAKTSSSS